MVHLRADVLPSERAVVCVDVQFVLEAVVHPDVLRVVLFPKIPASFGSLRK